MGRYILLLSLLAIRINSWLTLFEFGIFYLLSKKKWQFFFTMYTNKKLTMVTTLLMLVIVNHWRIVRGNTVQWCAWDLHIVVVMKGNLCINALVKDSKHIFLLIADFPSYSVVAIQIDQLCFFFQGETNIIIDLL